jgi:hypothetical protein
MDIFMQEADDGKVRSLIHQLVLLYGQALILVVMLMFSL